MLIASPSSTASMAQLITKLRHEKDMISDLPEDIVLYILSFLPTKDAVRTSIFSKKWRYLWTHLSVFQFEILQPCHGLEDQNPKSANCLFDLLSILLHKSDCVERLRVTTGRVTVDTDKVNSFVSSVLKYKIRDLELSLIGIINAWVDFPLNFLASESLNKLHLDLDLTLYIHSGIRFPSLKTLVLADVTFVDAKSVQRLFSGCPVLQELSLLDCYWENIKQINVANSTLRMLTIHLGPDCQDNENILTVKIDAVNLLYLRCISNPRVEFIIVNPTSIVDALVDHYVYDEDDLDDNRDAAHSAFSLLSLLSSAKSLKLTKDTLQCLSYAKDTTLHLLPSFHNLTHLHVLPGICAHNLDVLIDILHKTPQLEALTFPRGFQHVLDVDVEDLMASSMPCCFKSSLKLFSISHFDGDEDEVQLVRFLFKNVTALREIQISWSRYLLDDLELKELLDVWSQLQPHVNPGSCVIKFL